MLIVLPCLLSSSCQSSENHLKALDQDTDEEIVESHVKLEEVMMVRDHFLGLLECQHHGQVEDHCQECGGHVSKHQQAANIQAGAGYRQGLE